MKRALVTIAAAAAAALAAAPAAQAGWMTGVGNPPAYRVSDFCTNGMYLDYAYFLRDTTPHPDSVTVDDLIVSTAPWRGSSSGSDGPDQATIIATHTYTIPRRWYWIDPAAGLGGDPNVGEAGWFEYSGRIRVQWPAVAPGTDLSVGWKQSNGYYYVPRWEANAGDCTVSPGLGKSSRLTVTPIPDDPPVITVAPIVLVPKLPKLPSPCVCTPRS